MFNFRFFRESVRHTVSLSTLFLLFYLEALVRISLLLTNPNTHMDLVGQRYLSSPSLISSRAANTWEMESDHANTRYFVAFNSKFQQRLRLVADELEQLGSYFMRDITPPFR